MRQELLQKRIRFVDGSPTEAYPKKPQIQLSQEGKEMKSDKLFEYLGTTGSVVGAYLNAIQNISGFYVWCAGNLFWMVMAVQKRQWGTFLTFGVFTLLNIYGILHWSGKWFGVVQTLSIWFSNFWR